MEADIHFLAPYCTGVSLTAYSPAMEIICACSLRGAPWGSKVWHTFDMRDQDCNTTAEPPMCMSRLYTYVTITKPRSASLHSAITVPASTDKSFLLSQNGAGCLLCESYLYDICHSLLKVFDPQVQHGSLHLVRNWPPHDTIFKCISQLCFPKLSSSQNTMLTILNMCARWTLHIWFSS